jgi:hypothetical protein
MESTESLLARLRQRLAEDPRTNLLDAELEISGEVLSIGGEVDSESTLQAALVVIREILPPEMTIVNRLWTATYTAPTDVETLL